MVNHKVAGLSGFVSLGFEALKVCSMMSGRLKLFFFPNSKRKQFRCPHTSPKGPRTNFIRPLAFYIHKYRYGLGQVLSF